MAHQGSQKYCRQARDNKTNNFTFSHYLEKFFGGKARMEGGGLEEMKKNPYCSILRSLANAKFPLANTH